MYWMSTFWQCWMWPWTLLLSCKINMLSVSMSMFHYVKAQIYKAKAGNNVCSTLWSLCPVINSLALASTRSETQKVQVSIITNMQSFTCKNVTIETRHFLGQYDSALWICSECGSFIKAAGHCLLFHAVLLFVHSLCCMSEVGVNYIKIQSHPLSLSLPLTWSCLALDGSGYRHSGSCLHTATGWWPPGPSAEPSPRGWAQRRPWQYACRIRESTMWDRDT